MFNCKSWAMAFINSLEKEGGAIEEGVETFRALASWVSSLKGAIFGRVAAEKMEPLIRNGFSAIETLSQAQETAIKFFLLIVRKNAVRHIASVSEEIKKSLDKKYGVMAVFAEYAFEPGKEFESGIIETIKKRIGAARVELTGRVNPELIGGYRLRIGDEIIDASVRYQLRKMKIRLAAGGGN